MTEKDLRIQELKAENEKLKEEIAEYKHKEAAGSAYNVERVLEQIKELREYCSNTNCGDCKYRNTCFDAELEKIVKAGGVNG